MHSKSASYTASSSPAFKFGSRRRNSPQTVPSAARSFGSGADPTCGGGAPDEGEGDGEEEEGEVEEEVVVVVEAFFCRFNGSCGRAFVVRDRICVSKPGPPGKDSYGMS